MKHYSNRLPARVEWKIYQAFKDHFQSIAGRYSIDDLRTVAQIYERAEFSGVIEKDADPFSNHFVPGIKKLQQAEAILGKDAGSYFRAQAMIMLGEFFDR